MKTLHAGDVVYDSYGSEFLVLAALHDDIAAAVVLAKPDGSTGCFDYNALERDFQEAKP